MSETSYARAWRPLFRSKQHFDWFLLSMGILSASFLARWMLSVEVEGKDFPMAAAIVMRIVAGFHLFVSLSALLVTWGGRHNDHVWSRDCIWFNAVVAFAHLTLSYTIF